MATITDFASLQSTVTDFLDHSDLATIAPTLVQLCEAKLKRDNRARNMTSTTFSVTSDNLAVPTGLVAVESLYHDGPSYFGKIKIVSAQEIGDLKGALGTTGVPSHAAIIAGTFRFAPAPDTTYSTKIVYWQTLTSLTGTTSTNWLLSAHPDVYLYGTLAESAPYLKDDARIALWKGLYNEALDDLHQHTERAEFSGSMAIPLRTIG